MCRNGVGFHAARPVMARLRWCPWRRGLEPTNRARGLSGSELALARHLDAAMKVLGSIPRLFQVLATTTAGCHPEVPIAGGTNDITTRAAESELRTLAFMAILLEGGFV